MVYEKKIELIKKSKPFSTFDIIAIALSIIFCLSLIFIFKLNSQSGSSVIVKVNDIKYEYPLNTDKKIVFLTEKGEFEIVIKDNFVYVSKSPCKSKICVHHSSIKYKAQTIICADLKITITIKGKGGLAATT